MCEHASYEKEIQKHNASFTVNILNLFTKGFLFHHLFKTNVITSNV